MLRLPSRTFLKYLLVQVPGWVLLVGVLLALRSWMDLSVWVMPAMLGLAVAKDLVLYPLLRNAYEGDPRTGGEHLVGLRGAVAKPLEPHGYIRVRGELWQARVESSTPSTLPEGARVRIRGARGLLLTVEPE